MSHVYLNKLPEISVFAFQKSTQWFWTIIGNKRKSGSPIAYLTPETRRKRLKGFCLIIEIICLVHFAIIIPRDRVFTPEKWAHTPDYMRHKLMWSFYRQYQLEGMTREEVEKLLGKGDDLQGSVEYKLADDWIGGWRVYHIDYKQDRVIRAKETWQDWWKWAFSSPKK